MRTEVLKIRNTIYKVIDNFFRTRDFYEISPPILTSFSCENACVGGSDLISVNYYGRTAYLSQSGQLYLEALAVQLGQVYSMAPAFRAESTLLATHLSEFWMCEAEMMDISFQDLTQVINDLLISIIKNVIEQNGHELKVIDADIALLEQITEKPIPQITYSEALDILEQKCTPIIWGTDLSSSDEQILSYHFNNSPFMITEYPQKLSSFYKQTCPKNPEYTFSVDVIAPGGYGELVGGSMREYDVEKLRKSLRTSNASITPYEWYLDIISSNPQRHGGFGLGIERLISWLCKLSTIQDAIPFPRTEESLCP